MAIVAQNSWNTLHIWYRFLTELVTQMWHRGRGMKDRKDHTDYCMIFTLSSLGNQRNISNVSTYSTTSIYLLMLRMAIIIWNTQYDIPWYCTGWNLGNFRHEIQICISQLGGVWGFLPDQEVERVGRVHFSEQDYFLIYCHSNVSNFAK